MESIYHINVQLACQTINVRAKQGMNTSCAIVSHDINYSIPDQRKQLSGERGRIWKYFCSLNKYSVMNWYKIFLTVQLNNHMYFPTILPCCINPTCILMFTIEVDFIWYSAENFKIKPTVKMKLLGTQTSTSFQNLCYVPFPHLQDLDNAWPYWYCKTFCFTNFKVAIQHFLWDCSPGKKK